jgi:hypothetical protein
MAGRRQTRFAGGAGCGLFFLSPVSPLIELYASVPEPTAPYRNRPGHSRKGFRHVIFRRFKTTVPRRQSLFVSLVYEDTFKSIFRNLPG